MMKYASEENIRIFIALLKKHGIKKVIASPGTTNLNFVASIQHDDWFEVYSSVDERSAAYIACGMADQSGEPVIITCTEATASRNYLSGLTEAFYRKLPVLAVTGTRGNRKSGNFIPQSIDRSSFQNDICRISVELPTIKDDDDRTYCELTANKALLELKRAGGGPVHINLCTTYISEFIYDELPSVRKIDRISYESVFPEIKNNSKVAILLGSHKKFDNEELNLIDLFCEKYGSVVFCDNTSRYSQKYKVQFSLIGAQRELEKSNFSPDILIYFGGVSGGNYQLPHKSMWLVNEDGNLRDRSDKLNYVFEMTEKAFLSHYINSNKDYIKFDGYLDMFKVQYYDLLKNIPDLPFSNAWIASKSSKMFPSGSTVYLGILNTLRTWNYFEMPENVDVISNVGAFGIDGGLSSVLGAALVNTGGLNFGIVGDLGFFYDINSLGNRHFPNNVRIMLINNGRGIEFRIDDNIGSKFEDSEADKFFSAAGHFGDKSAELVKNLAGNLGFEYMAANSKEDYLSKAEYFFSEQKLNKPVIFEIFVNQNDERSAHTILRNVYREESFGRAVKDTVKKIIGDNAVEKIKKIIK